jgi:hypothetical protein
VVPLIYGGEGVRDQITGELVVLSLAKVNLIFQRVRSQRSDPLEGVFGIMLSSTPFSPFSLMRSFNTPMDIDEEMIGKRELSPSTRIKKCMY